MISLLATLVSKAKLPLSRYNKVNSSSMSIRNHSSEYLVFSQLYVHKLR